VGVAPELAQLIAGDEELPARVLRPRLRLRAGE
jgi:hypothetical protein